MVGHREFGPLQLSRWIGMPFDDFKQAWHMGLVPPPDLPGEHWSEGAARGLPEHAEAIRTALAKARPEGAADQASAAKDGHDAPKPVPRAEAGRLFGPVQLANWIGLKGWQIDRGVQRGVVPPPDVDGRLWSRELAKTLPEKTGEIRAVVGDHPGHGSAKAAELLAERTGLPVIRDDVYELRAYGRIVPEGTYRGHPMFGRNALLDLPEEHIEEVVRAREDWISNSLGPEQAADELGWSVGLFEVRAERRGIVPGRFGRYTPAELQPLRALAEQ